MSLLLTLVGSNKLNKIRLTNLIKPHITDAKITHINPVDDCQAVRRLLSGIYFTSARPAYDGTRINTYVGPNSRTPVNQHHPKQSGYSSRSQRDNLPDSELG